MAAPSYVTENNSAELSRVIKQGAIFIRPVGTLDIPTGPNWVPANTSTCIGYYSEDGFTLTREAGDSTDFRGHNKDIVLSEEDPGYWTPSFSGIESNQVTIETYFETAIGPDGSVTVTESGISKRFDIVTVGYTQKEELIIVHYPNVQISSREALQFNTTTLLAYGMTFRTFRGGQSAPYHLKAWGLLSQSGS